MLYIGPQAANSNSVKLSTIIIMSHCISGVCNGGTGKETVINLLQHVVNKSCTTVGRGLLHSLVYLIHVCT